jgi:hypothetical protein
LSFERTSETLATSRLLAVHHVDLNAASAKHLSNTAQHASRKSNRNHSATRYRSWLPGPKGNSLRTFSLEGFDARKNPSMQVPTRMIRRTMIVPSQATKIQFGTRPRLSGCKTVHEKGSSKTKGPISRLGGVVFGSRENALAPVRVASNEATGCCGRR